MAMSRQTWVKLHVRRFFLQLVALNVRRMALPVSAIVTHRAGHSLASSGEVRQN